MDYQVTKQLNLLKPSYFCAYKGEGITFERGCMTDVYSVIPAVGWAAEAQRTFPSRLENPIDLCNSTLYPGTEGRTHPPTVFGQQCPQVTCNEGDLHYINLVIKEGQQYESSKTLNEGSIRKRLKTVAYGDKNITDREGYHTIRP